MNPEDIDNAMKELNLRPIAFAKALNTSYSNLKQWRSGERNITPIGVRAIQLLLAVKGTEIGAKFGV